MFNKVKVVFGAVILLGLFACSEEAAKPTVNSELQLILDNYYAAETKLNSNGAIFKGDYRYNHIWVNTLSNKYIEDAHNLNEEYLLKIQAIEKSELTLEEQISYDIFLWDRELDKSSEKFPWEMFPINQFSSMPSFFALLGSGESAQPFKTIKDYEDFLKRTDGFLEWMTSAEVWMQKGIDEGLVQPTALMEKLITQLTPMIVKDYKMSIFWKPIANFPESFSDEDKERLSKLYKKSITEKLIPSYQKLQKFLGKIYLPATRKSSGLSDLPGGSEWYQWQITRHTTTTDLTADDIHKIGLKEVTRIHDEMREVKSQVEFEGDLQEFFKHLQTNEQFYFKSNQEVFDRYNLEREIVEKVIPKFFDVTPTTAFEIRPVEEFLAESAAGASYQAGTPDGSRPGIFYINTFNLKAQPIFGVETLYLHEAIPGHHFQISLAQEEKSLPEYRKFADYNAFSEGWALYVESIGKEMGLFTDPYQYYGRLSDELLRAMRLVMDTGLHAKGWSREKAIDYMMENSSMAESDVTAEVERYMAIPGQAVSYKIGQLRITAIRKWAEKELGEQFDIREFHNQVLLSGALPMAVLDNKIKHWVKSQQK